MDTIVVGVDGSKHSLEALHWAVGEGRRRGWSVEAVFARPYPYAVPTVGDLNDPTIELGRADEYLDALLHQELGTPADVAVTGRVAEGVPAKVLIDAAHDAELLVVGSRGRGGFAGLLLGSVSLHCAQYADCPVAVIHTDQLPGPVGEDRTPRIVVGIDESAASRAALYWAVAEARAAGAAVEAVHAWRAPYMLGYPFTGMQFEADALEDSGRQLLDAAVGGTPAGGVTIEPILVCGGAASVLLDAAKGADLLVVGAHNGSYAGMLLGSVTQKILHDAPCPVVVIPGRI